MISSTAKAMLALSATMAAVLSAAQQPQVQLNGEAVTFPDTQPQMIGTVVMVPLRTVFEKMGATVGWDEASQTVTCTLNGKTAILNVGDSEARVNGQMRYLDLPPRVIGDRTMVPMRFLGDAFGAQVTWNGDSDLVAIDTSTMTNTSTETITPVTPVGPVALSLDEVIPVTLDQELSSNSSHVGDTFTCTVATSDSDTYANLPSGTKIEGHVVAVQPMTDDQPAVLDLAFDRIDLPGLASTPITASLISLDNQFAMEGDDGTYQAQNSGKTFDRMAFVGYGTSSGQLVGIQDADPLTGSALTDSLSSIRSQLPEDEQQMTDIDLTSGTQFGIRVDSGTTLSQ